MDSTKPKHTSQGRVTKPGEMWLSIRIPEATGKMLFALAEANERSLSYTVRILLLAQIASLCGEEPNEYLNQLRVHPNEYLNQLRTHTEC